MREAHFLICIGRDHHDLAGLPALFNALSQLWKGFVISPDVERVSRPALPASVAYHAEFRVGVILPVILFVESIRETSGKHAIPEVVPLQQITYNAFAIQQVIANTPQEFEVQALDGLISAFCCFSVIDRSSLPGFLLHCCFILFSTINWS